MTDENNGNGTKLMVQVHNVEIEQLTDMVKQILANQERMFGVDGVCPNTRSANEAFKSKVLTNLVGLWIAIGGLAGGAWVIIQQLWK